MDGPCAVGAARTPLDTIGCSIDQLPVMRCVVSYSYVPSGHLFPDPIIYSRLAVNITPPPPPWVVNMRPTFLKSIFPIQLSAP